jgi:hypothetical protein
MRLMYGLVDMYLARHGGLLLAAELQISVEVAGIPYSMLVWYRRSLFLYLTGQRMVVQLA